MATSDETTRRLASADSKIVRMDTRLKMIKAADDVAAALERLHLAVQKAHDDDVKVVLADFPYVPFTAKRGEPAHVNVPQFTREVMLWAEHLRDPGRFEQLSTRRFDGS